MILEENQRDTKITKESQYQFSLGKIGKTLGRRERPLRPVTFRRLATATFRPDCMLGER